MLTAMLAVKNVLGASFDLWEVNAEGDYHEEVSGRGEGKGDGASARAHGAPTLPLVPERVRPARTPASASASALESEA